MTDGIRTTHSVKPVANWIIIGVGMLLVQVILGGVTRLTGSGLSITEWNVVTGTFPPLSESKWLAEFDKYKATPQYQILNTRFTLDDFKFIFFWEWFHRFWARLIGIVFVVGFVYLVSKKYLRKDMQIPLLLLFLLGAMQGAVGWIMVASGLEGDAVYVKPTRLALHFIFAMLLIIYAFWFALKLRIQSNQLIPNKTIYRFSLALMGLTLVQLIFGALMAGHKAANAAPTWPDINGYFLPPAMFEHGFLFSLIENKLAVHFVHRNLAYLLTLLTLLYSWKLFSIKSPGKLFRTARVLPLFLLILQVLLGIFTTLMSRTIVPNSWGSFEWLAQFHQVTGMLFLLSLILVLYLTQQTNHFIKHR